MERINSSSRFFFLNNIYRGFNIYIYAVIWRPSFFSNNEMPNNKPVIEILPLETLTLFFIYLRCNPLNFSLTCRVFYSISANRINRVDHLLERYGPGMVLYAVLTKHSAVLTPEVVTHLIEKRNVPIPTLILQELDFFEECIIEAMIQREGEQQGLGHDTIQISANAIIQQVRTLGEQSHSTHVVETDTDSMEAFENDTSSVFSYIVSLGESDSSEETNSILNNLYTFIDRVNYMPFHMASGSELCEEDTLIFLLGHAVPEILKKLAERGFYVTNIDEILWIRGFLSYHDTRCTYDIPEQLDNLYELGIISLSARTFVCENYPLYDHINYPFYDHSGLRSLYKKV